MFPIKFEIGYKNSNQVILILTYLFLKKNIHLIFFQFIKILVVSNQNSIRLGSDISIKP